MKVKSISVGDISKWAVNSGFRGQFFKRAKIFGVVSVLFLSVSSLMAEGFKSGDLYYNVLSSLDKTVEVTNSPSQNYSGSIVVPSTVDYNGVTYNVVAVGNNAFGFCEQLEKITLSAGIKKLDFEAFGYCYKLSDITLNDELELIEERAFASCESLKLINLPQSVSQIGNYAFSGCVALENVNVDKANNSYASDNGVLYSKDFKRLIYSPAKKMYVTVNEQTTRIESYAFYYAEVVNVAGADNLVEIGEFAFEACKSLVSVAFGNKLTTLETGAFQASGIEEINLPQSLKTLSGRVFEACEKLKSIVIPADVTTVGEYCFRGCKSLESVTMDSKVSHIQEYAFHSCSALKTIVCKAVNPPYYYFDSSGFTDEIYSNTTLMVPVESVNKYKNEAPWKNFKNIQGLSSEIVNCTTPTDLKAEEITETAIKTAWNADESNLSWDFRYREGDGEFVEVKDLKEKKYTIDNVKPSTVYLWSVKAHCAEASESNWAADIQTATIGTDVEYAYADNLNVYATDNFINIINENRLFIKDVAVMTVNGSLVGKYNVNGVDNTIIPVNMKGVTLLVRVTGESSSATYKIVMK